jgi:hypothetical protein
LDELLQKKASTQPDGLSKDQAEGHQAQDQASQKSRWYKWIVPDNNAATDSDRKDTNVEGTDGLLSHSLDVTLQARYVRKYGDMSPGECKRLREARVILAAFAAKQAEACEPGMCCVCVLHTGIYLVM